MTWRAATLPSILAARRPTQTRAAARDVSAVGGFRGLRPSRRALARLRPVRPVTRPCRHDDQPGFSPHSPGLGRVVTILSPSALDTSAKAAVKGGPLRAGAPQSWPITDSDDGLGIVARKSLGARRTQPDDVAKSAGGEWTSWADWLCARESGKPGAVYGCGGRTGAVPASRPCAGIARYAIICLSVAPDDHHISMLKTEVRMSMTEVEAAYTEAAQ